MMWCALKSVFTGGDIAKQLPKEAQMFAKLDKDSTKINAKGQGVQECGRVLH